MENKTLTEEEKKDFMEKMANIINYMEATRNIIYPMDKILYQTINNILSMYMISLGRKVGMEYEELEKKYSKDESEVDDIIDKISKETE
jgi:Mor family transcriptional regulator